MPAITMPAIAPLHTPLDICALPESAEVSGSPDMEVVELATPIELYALDGMDATSAS